MPPRPGAVDPSRAVGDALSGRHPHAQPSFEEQHVGFARYTQSDRWIYIEGPSGAGGHALTSKGIDGIAYNLETDQLEIVEQKGIARARKVGLNDDPTAVTVNLQKNLDDAIERLRRMGPLDSDMAVPRRATVLHRLRQLRAALDGHAPVPARTRIVITSAQAKGITRGLANYWRSRGVALPVEFESTAPVLRPAVAPSGPRGGPSPLTEAVRGTSNRATTARGTAEARTEPAPRRAASPDVPGTRGSVGLPDPSRPPTDLSLPRARIRPIAFRFVGTLIIDILVDIALGLFVSYFERQVAKETQARVADGWRDQIFPRIQNTLQTEMRASAEGSLSARTRVFIGVPWAVVMRELDEDFSDAVVWFTKFAAGSPGFGEIYERVEVDTTGLLRLELAVARSEESPWKSRLRGETFRRERVRGATNLVRYPFRTWVMVHDPRVASTVEWLRRDRGQLDTALAWIEREYVSLDTSASHDDSLVRIQTALGDYAYADAAREASAFSQAMSRGHGVRAQSITKRLDSFRSDVLRTHATLIWLAPRMTREQLRLLEGLLGARVFGARQRR